MARPNPPAPETSPAVEADGVGDAPMTGVAESPVDGVADQGVAIPQVDDLRSRRFGSAGSLRRQAARGTLINTAFTISLSALGLVKGFVIARFVSRADYGLWGILVISLATLLWLKQGAIGDKYIQQDEEDQELAFQKAFTLELWFTGAFVVLLAVAVPVVALAYNRSQLLGPGFLVALAVLASVFQSPLWVFYRRMQFVRQRALQAIDPVVSFAVSIGLAVAGAGYWAFVGGLLAGVCASALAAVALSPFKLRLRYERQTLRSYVTFSWPLFVAGASSLVMAQSAVIAANARLGLAAVGVIALAATISSFTERVDELVTGTLYPAICAIKDQSALLYESFVKSNRLALMWAVPFGVGITLFCSDLITYGIGERWRAAVQVLQVYGITAAISHIGFNWTAYLRAWAHTRPIAVANFAAAVAFLSVGIPLLVLFGLRGFAAGIAFQALVLLVFRAYYLQRLFAGFGFLGHAVRAFLPTVPAAAVVLLARGVEQGHRSLGVALAELAMYVLVTAAATWYFEAPLLREAAAYVGRRSAARAAA
jgi:O-antigen/teichoic acid export membrane protein